MPRATPRPDLLLPGYFLAVSAVITLAPFRPAWPHAIRLAWTSPPFDLVTNVLLFLPIGFVWPLAAGRRPRAQLAAVGIAGALASAALEAAQVFLPGRYPSLIDVATNGAGAVLGAALRLAARSALDARLVRGLALELPLMNLVYLLLPLLWLEALVAAASEAGSWLGTLPGLCGALVISAVWRHRLRPAGLPAWALPALVAAWFFAGSFPALGRTPALVIITAAGLGALVALDAAWTRLPRPDRRFEIPTLRLAAPFLGAYLIAALTRPWPAMPGPWRGALGLADIGDSPGLAPLLGLVQHLAGFTLLGYMVAEWRGRRETAGRGMRGQTAVVCAASAALAEAVAGAHFAHVASLLRLGLAVLASAYGAILYRAQIAFVRSLLEASPGDRRARS